MPREVEALDTIILARGGGSIEDLWAFNDERVALAVAASAVPVIAGVGHETDFTIADFVADLRAPTPSAAAAAAVPDRADMLQRLRSVQQGLADHALADVATARERLARIQQRLQREDPARQLDVQRQLLDDRLARLRHTMQSRLTRTGDRQMAAAQRLAALSPTAVLGRGYSIVQNEQGEIVTSPATTSPDESLWVSAAGGRYGVTRRSD